MEESGGGDIQRLPEGCISHVISLTTPRDSCRSSLVSTTFRSAAAYDTVWERFLPSDYKEILSRAVDSVEYSSKKELYFRLCDSILIDGGKMSFALEKSSGAKCYMLSARELEIVWGDAPHYWRWIPVPDCRFAEVAHLLNVCWLEIHGKINSRVLSPKTTYAAYLIFKLVEGNRGLDFPVQEVSVKMGAHESKYNVWLQCEEVRPPRGAQMFRRLFRGMVGFPQGQETEEMMGNSRVPCSRDDGWMEIEMGEFFNDEGEDGEVDMCLMEVKGGHWKSGLCIQGMEVRPKKK